jgi:hypothetical protein
VLLVPDSVEALEVDLAVSVAGHLDLHDAGHVLAVGLDLRPEVAGIDGGLLRARA